MKLPDQMNWVHINTVYKLKLIPKGSGDAVCFILNDLLNRELIRQNFKFEAPGLEQVMRQEQSEEEAPPVEADEVWEDEQHDSAASDTSIEQDYMAQSIVIYNRKFNVSSSDGCIASPRRSTNPT